MIARIWHGRVPKEKAGAYHQYVVDTGLQDYKKSDGIQGVYLFTRDEGGVSHFYTLTFWKNIPSIKKFAGEEYEKARYYPEDQDYLLELEPQVTHFNVLEDPESLDLAIASSAFRISENV